VATPEGARFDATLWSDVIELDGAEALAGFDEDFIAGRPAVTVHHVERGAAYYVGTNLDRAGMGWLLALVGRAAGVSSAGGAVEERTDLELIERSDGADRWLFALNHGATPAHFAIDRPAFDVLTGTRWEGDVTIDASDLVILRSGG
jgi:beta-galactosidase